MNERIYICHTFYHAYVTCLKEYHLRHGAMRSAGMPETTDPLSPEVTAIAGAATLVLSKMSNRFGTLADRARGCGLFENVVEFDEQPETAFPELEPLKRDTGSLVKNLLNRIRFCRRLGQLEEPFVPVDLTKYGDVYVFCDSDPIGYYLNYKKIRYHAVEDGLNCIEHFDAARFDNRGHFDLKAKVASTGLIFIQNGWSRYCIDMEVNDISRLEYPCPKYVELPRDGLVSELTQEDKDVLLKLFVENMEELGRQLSEGQDRHHLIGAALRTRDESEDLPGSRRAVRDRRRNARRRDDQAASAGSPRLQDRVCAGGRRDPSVRIVPDGDAELYPGPVL